MPFADYFDLVDPLILPIRGKQYRIPPVAADNMARWTTFRSDTLPRIQAGETVPDSEIVTDDDFFRMFLGDAYEQMRADSVRLDVILHAARTAHTDALHGRDVAELVWADTNPKAPAAPPQTAPTKPKDRKPSRSTAAAGSTRRRASTSGTTSRTKSAGS
jgi:hypothetical protein